MELGQDGTLREHGEELLACACEHSVSHELCYDHPCKSRTPLDGLRYTPGNLRLQRKNKTEDSKFGYSFAPVSQIDNPISPTCHRARVM